MITIECNNCGKESDNKHEFDCARFSYIDEEHTLRFIHLCTGCQKELQKAEEEMFAVFMGVPELRNWERHNGIN